MQGFSEERYKYFEQLSERFNKVVALRQLLENAKKWVHIVVPSVDGVSNISRVPISNLTERKIQQLVIADLKEQLVEMMKGLEEPPQKSTGEAVPMTKDGRPDLPFYGSRHE